jgi:hypothetical protein
MTVKNYLFVNSCVRSIIRNQLKYVSLPQFFFPIEESFLRVAEYTGPVANLKLDKEMTYKHYLVKLN